jgi:hypothetical protein
VPSKAAPPYKARATPCSYRDPVALPLVLRGGRRPAISASRSEAMLVRQGFRRSARRLRPRLICSKRRLNAKSLFYLARWFQDPNGPVDSMPCQPMFQSRFGLFYVGTLSVRAAPLPVRIIEPIAWTSPPVFILQSPPGSIRASQHRLRHKPKRGRQSRGRPARADRGTHGFGQDAGSLSGGD